MILEGMNSMKTNFSALKDTMTQKMETLEKENIENKKRQEEISQVISDINDQIFFRNHSYQPNDGNGQKQDKRKSIVFTKRKIKVQIRRKLTF
jgi:hypothetical protein